MTRELLFKVTAKDCRWDYYRGTGSGGQNKNKTDNCARCTHLASGAVGKSEDGRSKDLNRRKAFERMCNTPEFKKWIKIEVSRVTGEQAIVEEKVDAEMLNNTVVEKQVDGKWIDAPELAVNDYDIRNMRNG